MVRATDPVGHEGCCQALKKLAFGAELTGIQVPTLILGGELDKGAPVDVLAETAAKIPGAKHVVIPGAGHITALESPEVFQRALDEFLVSL
jgi:3-oxoadipate enol-lactonase